MDRKMAFVDGVYTLRTTGHLDWTDMFRLCYGENVSGERSSSRVELQAM